MTVTITPEALVVIRRSLELAGADPAETAVRVRVAGGAVRSRFVTQAEPTDVIVEAEGIRVFVAEDLARDDVEIAVTEEHDQLTVRPK